jgi:2'-5' RNA ligase
MAAQPAEEIVAYWLTPAERAREYFGSLISELATRFNAPIFEPHLTLYVTNAGNDNPAEVLEDAIANSQPLRLSLAGISYSDQFSKTLFVQFRRDEALATLSEKLRSASVSPREYELNPHLSLIYKEMPPGTKMQIANSLCLPFTEVEFDSVKAVVSPAKIETGDDVKSWRVVATQSLTK